MSDWTECPNGCGQRVEATWVNLDGSWDGPQHQRPYKVPACDGQHVQYECPGSFRSGAAVLGGIVGMAEAIRERGLGACR